MEIAGWILASLVDGDVFSQELKPKPHLPALRWMQSTAREETYLSVITIGESRAGIEMLDKGP